MLHGEFDQFYERYISFVFRIAFRLMKNKAEAEDVCHDIFLDILLNPDKFNPSRGSIEAWLAVKTRNLCYDRLRKKKPVLIERWEDALSSSESVNSVEFNVLSKVEKEALHHALEQIPPAQRKALYGAYFEGRTHRELAVEMKRPLGTIKSLLRYGLNNLKKQKDLLAWVQSGEGGKKHDPQV